MADAEVALVPSTPWTMRLIARARVSAFWAGLAVSGACFAFYLLYSALLGDGPGSFLALGGRTWPSELGWSLVIGMAPAVTVASLRGSIRDLDDLAPALRVSPQAFDALRREICTVPRAFLGTVGTGVAIWTVLLLFQGDEVWASGHRPELHDPVFLWYIGRNVVNWWLISRAITIEVVTARAFSRLAARLPAVDLLDRAPLAPFGRRGLRSVLLWMLYLSLFSLQYLLGSAQPILAAGLLMVVSIAIATLLLPVWGAHVRLREAKAAELAAVYERLREARQRALGAPSDEVAGGRLADLVAWERRVATCSEWPLGGTTVLRFLLYTGIGLGSWLGAAFVERLLDTALG